MNQTPLVIFTGLAIALAVPAAPQVVVDTDGEPVAEALTVSSPEGPWVRVGIGAPLRSERREGGGAQLPALTTQAYTVLDADSGAAIPAGTVTWHVPGAPGELTEASWRDEDGLLDLPCRGGETLTVTAPGYGAARVRTAPDGRRHSILLHPTGNLRLQLEPAVEGRLWLARQNAINVTHLFTNVAEEHPIGPEGSVAVTGLARGETYVGVILATGRAPVVGSFSGLPQNLAIPLDDGLEVTGTVRDQEGTPLAGARVEAMGELVELDNFRYRQVSRTDADGRFHVPGLLAGPVRVQACAPGRACSEQVVELTAEAPADPVILDLVPGRDVLLRVRNEVHEPVADATLYLRDRLYRTDARGELRLDGLPVGTALPVQVFGDGFGLWEGELVADKRRVEIVVPGGAAIEQQVLAVTRFDAAEVAVRWQAYDPDGRRTSAGEGAWDGEHGIARATGLPAGTYTLSVRLPGSATLDSERVTVAAGEHVVLPAAVPDRGLAIAGRVVDGATLEPVAGAAVSCEPGSPSIFRPPSTVEDVFSVVTDADGMFLLEGLDPGVCRAVVRAPGYAAWRRDGIEPDETGFDIGDVELDAGLTIVGRVSGRDGSPLTGVRVEITESAAYAYFPESTVRTNHDGWFRAAQLPAGKWTVTARHAGQKARQQVSGAADETLEVDLQLGGTALEGEIWLGDARAAGGALVLTTDGSQAGGMVVMMQRVTVGREIFGIDRQPISLSVTGDGRFSGTGIDPGRYYAAYTPPEPGAAPVTKVLDIPPVERFQVSLQYADAAVTGVVVDSDGLPVAGAAVVAEAGDGVQQVSTFSDVEGRFAVRGLEPGRLVLTARHGEFSPAEPFEMELLSGSAEGPVTLRLGPPEGAHIVLAVQAVAGSTGGAPVYLVGPETATGFTDGGGLATFSGVTAGTYRPCGFAYGGATGCGLDLMVDRGEEVQAQLDLGRGGWVDIQLANTRASAKSTAGPPRATASRGPTVRVVTADGIDISSLLFMASPPQAVGGGLRIGPLQADDYIITVTTEQGPRQGQVQVREGQPVALDLG